MSAAPQAAVAGRSLAAHRHHGLSIIAGALYLELKELAGMLNAFGESPAANPISPTLDRMRRAAHFCGFWGVGNYLGGLRELAHGIESNPPLSVDRAASTRSYLAARGVDGRRIAIDGMGERYPIAANGSADGRARNRRVEIFVGGRPRG